MNNTLSTTTSNDAGDALTGGNVQVTGNASTTSVSVTQTAAAARTASKAAVVDGGVTIADANEATASFGSNICVVARGTNKRGTGIRTRSERNRSLPNSSNIHPVFPNCTSAFQPECWNFCLKLPRDSRDIGCIDPPYT